MLAIRFCRDSDSPDSGDSRVLQRFHLNPRLQTALQIIRKFEDCWNSLPGRAPLPSVFSYVLINGYHEDLSICADGHKHSFAYSINSKGQMVGCLTNNLNWRTVSCMT